MEVEEAEGMASVEGEAMEVTGAAEEVASGEMDVEESRTGAGAMEGCEEAAAGGIGTDAGEDGVRVAQEQVEMKEADADGEERGARVKRRRDEGGGAGKGEDGEGEGAGEAEKTGSGGGAGGAEKKGSKRAAEHDGQADGDEAVAHRRGKRAMDREDPEAKRQKMRDKVE